MAKTCPFKAGDRVQIKNKPEMTDIVISVMGMPEYDEMNYSSPERGFRLKYGLWDFWDSYELAEDPRIATVFEQLRKEVENG